MSSTIIFCTDHSVPIDILEVVIRNLKEVSKGINIISVSHRPIALGTNISIGKHKRSWLTLYKQLSIGLKAAKTDNVIICEHDCLYTREHLEWVPSRDDTFYYNENVWLVQWSNDKHKELKGMYSRYWRERLALSQLICNRELYLDTLERRLDILDKDRSLAKLTDHIYEPGLSKVKEARKWADSGRPVYLKEYIDTLELERYKTFRTKLPNLDIRHEKNFTGPKRGRQRCYEVPYWGKFKEIMEN